MVESQFLWQSILLLIYRRLIISNMYNDIEYLEPCQDGLVVSVSPSHAVGCGFASRLGHTKDYDKSGTFCLLAWHAGFRVRV